MKYVRFIIIQHKWLTLTVIFTASLLAMMSYLGIHQLTSINHPIFALSNWITAHHIVFLLWHALLMIAIYLGWGKKVDRDAKRYDLSPQQVTRAKRLRYAMVAFIIVIDIILLLRHT